MKKRFPLFWLLGKIRRRIPALIGMTIFNMAHALLGVFFALGCKKVIDSAISAEKINFFFNCLLQGAIILGILVCIVVYRHLKDRLVADLDRDWKRTMLHGLLHGDYTSVSAYHSGELLHRMNHDVRIVNEGLVILLPGVMAMVTQLFSAVVVLAALQPVFTGALLCGAVLVVLFAGLLRHRLKIAHREVSETTGRVSAFLQETLEKLLMVQALDVAREMEQRTDVLLEERYKAQIRRKNISLVTGFSINLLSYAASFAALVWCAAGLIGGTVTFGGLTAVMQLVSQLQRPVMNLSGIIPQYAAISAAAERLMELDAVCGEESPTCTDVRERYDELAAICAESLDFCYDREHVLQNVSFRLPKGGFTVVTGPSGIGKSTLLKLMLGVFQPDRGCLSLECSGESIPVTRSTRGLFAYVPQGNLLLSGTLRENLTITRPQASEEELRQAVYVGCLDDVIDQLPNGLDTMLGESGHGLSEGQAQRLAIARAVLSGAPILLLDESTSALDAETEHLVLERISALPDRTCIAVTHRPAALEQADWQLELSADAVRLLPLKSEWGGKQ